MLCAFIVSVNAHSYLGDGYHNHITILETEAKGLGHLQHLLGVRVKVQNQGISSLWLTALTIVQCDVMVES